MGGSNNTGDGLASQARRYWVPRQPCVTGGGAHQGQTSRAPQPTPHPWSPQPDPVYPCTTIAHNRNSGR